MLLREIPGGEKQPFFAPYGFRKLMVVVISVLILSFVVAPLADILWTWIFSFIR